MHTQTVMIVDDDDDDRLLFGEALLIASPATQIITAINGENALKILQQPDVQLPEFIFLDLNMPKMTGWQCLFHLRKIDILSCIPVIIFSTSKDHSFPEIAMPDQNVYVFTKPAKFSYLVNGLISVLHKDWNAIKEMNKAAYK